MSSPTPSDDWLRGFPRSYHPGVDVLIEKLRTVVLQNDHPLVVTWRSPQSGGVREMLQQVDPEAPEAVVAAAVAWLEAFIESLHARGELALKAADSEMDHFRNPWKYPPRKR